MIQLILLKELQPFCKTIGTVENLRTFIRCILTRIQLEVGQTVVSAEKVGSKKLTRLPQKILWLNMASPEVSTIITRVNGQLQTVLDS